MSLIPDQNRSNYGLNLMPMIDFLFLLLSFFAVLAISRSALFESNIDLVKMKNHHLTKSSEAPYQINLSIQKNGQYKWLSQKDNFDIGTPEKIKKEILYQYSTGQIPEDKSKTKILLHIDKNAPWESIAQLVMAIKETGFEANPVYLESRKN